MLSTVTCLHLHPLNHITDSHTPQKLTATHLLHSFASPSELKQLHAHFIITNSSLTSLPPSRIALVCSLNPSFAYARKLFHHLDTSETEAWNSCLKAFAEGNDSIEAVLLFNQLQSFRVSPDSFTLSFVLEACTRLSDVSIGRVVHGYVEKLGFQSKLFLMNMILNLYTLCGGEMDDIKGAYDVFLRMPGRSVRSWTLMISGSVQCGKPKETIGLFSEMEEVGVRPNEVMVVAVLVACADWGDLGLGRRIHEFSNQSGFSKNVRVSNTSIEMYVKCGCLEDACKVFDGMKERTVLRKLLRLFSKMIQKGMDLNDVSFVGVLHASSHIGMTNDYGIVPRIEHYGCMVDLLSRAGLLQEARDRHLSELDSLNDGYYVVLSNIYAEAQRWEDTATVRKIMRDRGVRGRPGGVQLQWMEWFTSFYVPNTSVVLLDMEEDQKEKFLYRHRGKLVLNLRVCEDCHAAFKLISAIVSTESVVCDRNRFHCFKDGFCSCRDY
ncbi:pentatricopeptide repeat-containing protein [Pyrus ussuriensis x Pyrus communis]|uniref:Pentatricopeptide repeat-containing protein n=1 Tax=Pyrus ussuriensis x Pyrus communis TaxID=2448454 RepID=A0A5N5GML0_9ROSA|nr:pentatricopeptide repeat-containing protein [Pyrus ussuriensis x Pyrus communis]